MYHKNEVATMGHHCKHTKGGLCKCKCNTLFKGAYNPRTLDLYSHTIALPVDAPTLQPEPSHVVTCRLTIDNVVSSVSYDGIPLTSSTGVLGWWNQVKTYTFASTPNGRLVVSGHDAYSGSTISSSGVHRAGFAMECMASGGPWEHFSSETSKCTSPQGSMCVSNDGFFLPHVIPGGWVEWGIRNDHQKLWPCSGSQYATFSCKP